MEREVCIPLEFTVNNSIPVCVSGCGTGGGQDFLLPWDLEDAKSLWAVMLGMVKWTGYACWIE